MEAWSSGRVGASWHLKQHEGDGHHTRATGINREADKHKERTDRDLR
jgi:hypothetical protein